MATQLKDKSTTKHDAFIEAQLARVESRIRLIDLTAAGLGFVAGTLAFAVLMVLLDQRFALSAGTRQLALLVYLVGAAVYLALTVIRPLRWRVNPYYAARQLEQTVPGARNHVINWIDLHGAKVPAVLKGTLGQRAAKDLSKADVDTAISNRRALMAGGATAVSVLLFVVLFLVFGPSPFYSLLSRAFTPFGRGSEIASRTQVKILRPKDTTVTIGNPITIVAEVGGRVPNARDEDAPCLLYRHQDGEPYRQRFLQPDDTNQEWFATIGPLDVGNGFIYKVRAGDAETLEYRVDVRAAPLIADFLATYRYRPYVGKADRTRTSRKLEDLQGTEVTLFARTNRAVKEGRLEFEGTNGVGDLLRSQPVPNDPKALQFKLVLDRPGKYRIRFTSADNEVYTDSLAYEVQVLPDLPPQVRLTAPAKDVTLPANGHLELKGDASDDIGIASLTLRLQIAGGPEFKSKPFMADKLNTPNYGTPRTLDYKELLELSTLQDSSGSPVELRPGTEIEYWLEAADACDYPRPNVTASNPRYKITIAEASKDDAKQQKEREAARNRQKENQKQQQDQLKKEKADRDAERKKEQKEEEQDARNREEERKKKDKGESKEGKSDPTKEKDKSGTNAKDKETARKAEELKEKLEQKEKEEAGKREDKGEEKPGKGKAGEKKDGKEKAGKDKPGEGRGAGGQDSKNPAGEKKGEKQEGGKPGDKGEGRDEGKSDPKDAKGEGKKGSEKAQAGGKPGQGKETPGPKPRPGEGKGAGKAEPGKGKPSDGAGERKPENPPKAGDPIKQGEARDSKTPGQPTDPKPGEGKPGASGSKGKEKGKPDDKKGSESGSSAGNTSEKNRSKPEDAKPSKVKDLLRQLKEFNDRQEKNKAKRDLQDIKDKARDPQSREAAKQALEQIARDAKPSEVKELQRELKKIADREEKNRAKRDLQDIKDKASDPQAREAAKQALEEAARDSKGEDKVPGKGSDPKNPKKGNPPSDPTRGKGKEPKGPGEGEGDSGKGKKPGERRGNNPGEGSTGDRLPDDGRGSGDSPRFDPENPEKHRASTMQLEEFRKKVDKNILKGLKMSPEDYQKFLKDYADLAKRQEKADAEVPEVVAPPQRKGSLPSVVGRSTKPGTGKTDDVRSEGRPQPPPEYRDKYADFNRFLREPVPASPIRR